MTLDLTEARRLHDRNPNDPRYCATCGTFNDPAGTYPVKWPCPTAIALGATGRSEWSNTVRDDQCSNDPDTWSDCTCGHARGTHKQDALCRNCDCDTYNPPCPATDGDRTCDDVTDHYGVHTCRRYWWPNDRDANDEPHCPTPRCRQFANHPGPCHQRPEPTNEKPPW